MQLHLVKLKKIKLNTTDLPGVVTGAVPDVDFFAMGNPQYTNGDSFILKVTPTRAGNTLKVVGKANSTSAQTSPKGSSIDNYVVNATKGADVLKLSGAIGAKGINENSVLTKTEILKRNNMLVVFDLPTDAAAPTKTTAWGVPIWNGNVLIGTRIVDGGLGYVQGSATSIKSTLVPNPWYNGNKPKIGDTVVEFPWDIKTTLGGGISTDASQDIMGLLNHASMLGAANAKLEVAATTKAKLVLNVTKGLGYSVAPKFVLYSDNLNLTEYDGTEKSAGGVLTFSSTINSKGEVIAINGLTSPKATTLVRRTLKNSVVPENSTSTTEIDNEYVFDLNTAPAYGTTGLKSTTIEDLSTALTKELNNSVAKKGVGAMATINDKGEIASVSFEESDSNGDWNPSTEDNANLASRVEIKNGDNIAGTSLVKGPNVTVSKSSATGSVAATLESYVTLDPRMEWKDRRITRIIVKSGGSGYNMKRSNSYWRTNGGGTLPTPQGAELDGQPFFIVGGNATQGQGQNQWQFDAYPGLTYVRDVHYGTGVRLD